jgi:hypothetical protein
MSKVGTSQASPPQTSSLPWSEQASEQVQQTRRAITAHMQQDPVSNDMAPMMSELLRRLESFVHTERPGAPRGPDVPDRVHPPSPAEAGAAISGACNKLRHEQLRLSPDGAHRVEAMLRVLEAHIERKQEVVLRSELEAK